jgi:hypothetical protein
MINTLNKDMHKLIDKQAYVAGKSKTHCIESISQSHYHLNGFDDKKKKASLIKTKIMCIFGSFIYPLKNGFARPFLLTFLSSI